MELPVLAGTGVCYRLLPVRRILGPIKSNQILRLPAFTCHRWECWLPVAMSSVLGRISDNPVGHGTQTTFMLAVWLTRWGFCVRLQAPSLNHSILRMLSVPRKHWSLCGSPRRWKSATPGRRPESPNTRFGGSMLTSCSLLSRYPIAPWPVNKRDLKISTTHTNVLNLERDGLRSMFS